MDHSGRDTTAGPPKAGSRSLPADGGKASSDGIAGASSRVHRCVLGPARFNRRLGQLDSKAQVHFAAFRELLTLAGTWPPTARQPVSSSDKHGGRHYYLEPLVRGLSRCLDRPRSEGPELSRYTLRSPGRRLELSLSPRADATDGLVALASIVSKTIRELWMDVFNAYWTLDSRGCSPPPAIRSMPRGSDEPSNNWPRTRICDPDLWWRK